MPSEIRLGQSHSSAGRGLGVKLVLFTISAKSGGNTCQSRIFPLKEDFAANMCCVPPGHFGFASKQQNKQKQPQKQTKMQQLSCVSLWHRHLSDRAQALVFFADVAVAVLHFLVLCFRLGQKTAHTQPYTVMLFHLNAVPALTDEWLYFRKAIIQWLRNKLKFVLIFIVGSFIQECIRQKVNNIYRTYQKCISFVQRNFNAKLEHPKVASVFYFTMWQPQKPVVTQNTFVTIYFPDHLAYYTCFQGNTIIQQQFI
ncbi:Hypothetical_protein [Hexamita inflata]|uniref:Hypothetical_protein n=1 Tax=Hexamita inflata TaxID=28002 RepID=A0AA86P6C1_9EUKA|nr:Hypothetical protein HINF_LOCUS20359 [Hexamita inflata]